MMTTWPSPAKLNLFLYITGQRSDGYHNLQTLFQFLDYGDSLEIEVTSNGQLVMAQPVDSVADEDNLIIRAARLLKAAALSENRVAESAGAVFAVQKKFRWAVVWGVIECGHGAGSTQPPMAMRILRGIPGKTGAAARRRCAGVCPRICRFCRRCR